MAGGQGIFVPRYNSIGSAISLTISRRHRVSTIVLLTYVISGILLEVTHHDASALRVYSGEVISSHDCGASEMHVSTDRRHDCLACSHITWRVAIAPLSAAGLFNALNLLFLIPSNADDALQSDFLSQVSRGPPLSLA